MSNVPNDEIGKLEKDYFHIDEEVNKLCKEKADLLAKERG